MTLPVDESAAEETSQERCPECEAGDFIVQGVPGRTAIARPGIEIELPADLELPSCSECRAWTFFDEHEDALRSAIEAGLRAWRLSNGR